MYEGVLRKISTKTDKHALRTEHVHGKFSSLPKTGKGFLLLGESLDFEGGIRSVTTSEVKEVLHDESEPNKLQFQTLNSLYELSYTFISTEEASA